MGRAVRVHGFPRGTRHAASSKLYGSLYGASLRTPMTSGPGSVDDGEPVSGPASPPTGGNPYYYVQGQCTWWADQMRPDITAGSDGLVAREWEGWARAHGFPVDTTPRVGDVASWQPGPFAADTGHVAYVEAADAIGVYVSEMNAGGNQSVTRRYLDSDRLAAAVFIHRK